MQEISAQIFEKLHRR